ncbi:MAG: response regulator [Candidatus Wildermuthbacteria bacterium]|nr:response regulator [Candidatus Wildermuthbacteria bacterium]
MQKILVIEDDPFLRELTTQKLSKEGYEVFESADGEKGLELAKEKKPNLVLLDMMLPGIDGFRVLQHLKENHATNSIPVVILSNLGGKEDVERALELGAADFLIKVQFTPEEVIEKIRTHLA